MQAVQIKQIQQQFLHKRLMEARSLPRLSLVLHESRLKNFYGPRMSETQKTSY